MIINMSGGKAEKRKKEFSIPNATMTTYTGYPVNSYYLDAGIGGNVSSQMVVTIFTIQNLDFEPSKIRVELFDAGGSTNYIEIWDKELYQKFILRMRDMGNGDVVQMGCRTGNFWNSASKSVTFMTNQTITTPNTAKITCWE